MFSSMLYGQTVEVSASYENIVVFLSRFCMSSNKFYYCILSHHIYGFPQVNERFRN